MNERNWCSIREKMGPLCHILQLNKFNNLLNKKEGNITRVNSPQYLAVSQAGTHLPPGEGSSLAVSQAGSQASQALQAGTHLPSREGSNLPLASQAVRSKAVAHLPLGEGSSLVACQAGTHLLSGEGGNLVASQATHAGRQVAPFSPEKEAV